MLEIILLVVMCKSIGNTIRAKGRSPIGYQLMLVGMWIGGEIGGAVVGAIVLGGGMGVYGYAIGGAVVGAVATFIIVKSISPIISPSYQATGGFPVSPMAAQPMEQRRY